MVAGVEVLGFLPFLVGAVPEVVILGCGDRGAVGEFEVEEWIGKDGRPMTLEFKNEETQRMVRTNRIAIRVPKSVYEAVKWISTFGNTLPLQTASAIFGLALSSSFEHEMSSKITSPRRRVGPVELPPG